MTSGQDLNKINSLFSELQKMVSCDGPCLKNKEAEKLKQKMEDAKTNIITAPNQLQTAVKNYFVFTGGEAKYNEIREEQLKARADQIINRYKEKYNEITQKIKTQIETYEGIFINFKNVNDLYLKYKQENAELMKNIKNTTNDILTNQRKTYYQDEQSNVLKYYYYYILFVIYGVCVFCYAIFSFLYPSKIDWKIRFAIFIALNLLPFISTWLLGLFIYIVYSLFNLLPKNVYKEELHEKTNINYMKNL
jgi:hypothetical protein